MRMENITGQIKISPNVVIGVRPNIETLDDIKALHKSFLNWIPWSLKAPAKAILRKHGVEKRMWRIEPWKNLLVWCDGEGHSVCETYMGMQVILKEGVDPDVVNAVYQDLTEAFPSYAVMIAGGFSGNAFLGF